MPARPLNVCRARRCGAQVRGAAFRSGISPPFCRRGRAEHDSSQCSPSSSPPSGSPSRCSSRCCAAWRRGATRAQHPPEPAASTSPPLARSHCSRLRAGCDTATSPRPAGRGPHGEATRHRAPRTAAVSAPRGQVASRPTGDARSSVPRPPALVQTQTGPPHPCDGPAIRRTCLVTHARSGAVVLAARSRPGPRLSAPL